MPIVLDGPPSSTPPGSPTDFTFASIYPFVLPAAKSAALGIVDRSIVSAADILLRRARLWNIQLAPVVPVVNLTDPDNPVGQSDYSLPVPSGAQVTKLMGWAQGGVRRQTLTLEEAVQLGLQPGNYAAGSVFFDGDWIDGIPAYPVAYMVNETVVRVLPAPLDTSETMVFWVQCTVMNGATTLPGALQPYIRLLSYGALAILQSLPQKDFTDLQQAALNQGRFDDGVAKLGLRVTRAFGAGNLRRMPRSY